MDLILKRRDAIKIASEDWKKKWTPAIISYSQSLKGKMGQDCRSIITDIYSCENTMCMQEFRFIL